MDVQGDGIRSSLSVSSQVLPTKWRAHVKSFLVRFDALFQIDCAVLYGSRAAGTYTPRSDIDLVVISEHVPSDFLSRLKAISDLYEPGAPIEALAYTPDEFHNMIEDMHVTALDATTQGIPLVNADAFARFQAHTAELQARGLRRAKHAWVMDAPRK